MTVTVNAASSLGGNAAGQTTLSWLHTCGAGCSLLAVGGGNTTNKTIASVTYGGNSLTFLTSVVNGTAREGEAWYLVNPTPGTATITWGASARVVGGPSRSSAPTPRRRSERWRRALGAGQRCPCP